MLLYRVVDNPEDVGVLQQDIDTISDRVSTHHLTLNISKTNISRSHLIASALSCNGTPLEQVREHTNKATPIKCLVSGPPPASIFGNL